MKNVLFALFIFFPLLCFAGYLGKNYTKDLEKQRTSDWKREDELAQARQIGREWYKETHRIRQSKIPLCDWTQSPHIKTARDCTKS